MRVCLYVLCGHLLGKGWPLGSRLLCLLWVCHFPIAILGQVWYLIVSIPDLCTLTYFVGSLLINTPIVGVCNCSMFCCALACVHSSVVLDYIDSWSLHPYSLLQSSWWGREPCLSSWCLVIVVWLFITMSWVCLQFVIVVFPNHTCLLYLWVNYHVEFVFITLHSCDNNTVLSVS